MQPKAAAGTAPFAPAADRPPREANFYSLSFASQLIVWAFRKRLIAVARAEDDTRDDDDAPAKPAGCESVLQVFHMVGWGEVYAALLTLVDVMIRGHRCILSARKAIALPGLNPFEAALLNSLAHLQCGAREEAAISMCEIVPPMHARLAIAHLQAIVSEATRGGLRFDRIDLSTLPVGCDALMDSRNAVSSGPVH